MPSELTTLCHAGGDPDAEGEFGVRTTAQMRPNVKKPESNYVHKYFDLIDEFIKVRVCSADVLDGLQRKGLRSKSSYQRRIADICLPEYRTRILPAVAKLKVNCEGDIVGDLLYHVCIDVNPVLEIHGVSLPGPDNTTEDVRGPNPRRTHTKEKPLTFRKVLGIERALRREIIGQDEAIDTLVRAVKKSAVGLKRPGVPIGSFLLIGHTGTGKTELAKVLARTLYDVPVRLIRVDCSEYALAHEYSKLIGSPPGYIGHGEGGFLTESVRQNKSCIVLFDEIEKAHSKVHDLLLQLLDEGTLTDGRGRVVSFSETIVIMTSNLGIEKLDALKSRVGFANLDKVAIDQQNIEEATLEGMRECFRPEFINRIDEVVVFNPLNTKVCARIAHRMLKEIASLLAPLGLKVKFSSGVKNLLAREGFSAEYGARELRRLIKRKIEDPLTDLILSHQPQRDATILVSVRVGEPSFEIVHPDPSLALDCG